MRVSAIHRQPSWRATALLALLLVSVIACADRRLPTYELDGATMGTRYNILLIDPPNSLQLGELRTDIQDSLDAIEAVASTYSTTAELSALNRNNSTEPASVSAALCEMLQAALVVSAETNGAFDITIGELVNLWGFGPDARPTSLPSATEIATALDNVGYQHLEVDCGRNLLIRKRAALAIDLSGWAKGYAVDQIVRLISQRGFKNFLVEVGGEVSARGLNAASTPFTVGLENPLSNDLDSLPVIEIRDKGVATSGDYRNFIEYAGINYSHTIDPKTGRPIRHSLAAVTVVHDSVAYADAMATALLVLGPDAGLKLSNKLDIAAYFAVRDDGDIRYIPSRNFKQSAYLLEAPN